MSRTGVYRAAESPRRPIPATAQQALDLILHRNSAERSTDPRCVTVWAADDPCPGWGFARGAHACGRPPDHHGEHHCRCGAAHPTTPPSPAFEEIGPVGPGHELSGPVRLAAATGSRIMLSKGLLETIADELDELAALRAAADEERRIRSELHGLKAR